MHMHSWHKFRAPIRQLTSSTQTIQEWSVGWWV